MARSVNKSGPPRWSPAEQHGTAVSDPPTPREGESWSGSGAGTQRTVPGTRARTSHCLRALKMPLSMRPLPDQPRVPGPVRRAPGSPPCVSGRQRGTDCQGERPGSVAENPGPEVPTSGTETHTEARTHTHALPEVDKYRPTNTKCHRGRKSALTSCYREDRMPTPGHCHFHLEPGTWAQRAHLPPYVWFEIVSSHLLSSAPYLPTSQVCEQENNTSKAPSGGARTRREPQCAGDGGRNVPVTGRVAPGILTTVP